MKVLVADIGGTNARFAIYEKKILWHTTAPTTGSIITIIKNILKQPIAKNITTACIASAGLLTHNRTRCQITNCNWTINTTHIKKVTKLKKILLINDFEAIGYALNELPQLKLRWLRKRLPKKHTKIAIIGAGTGLGHSLCIKKKHYQPLPSEGGSLNPLPLLNKETIKLHTFLKKRGKALMEDVVSGRGISNLYRYYKGKAITDPAKILEQTDPAAKKAYETFERYYGIAARQFCYYTLPDVLLVTGGIAIKNQHRFGKIFLKTLSYAPYPSSNKYMNNLPVALIIDPDVGLKGAAWLARHS